LQLLFIYNANSGALSKLMDSAHKILQPSTYDCHLCALTFGKFSEKKKWKKFRKQSSVEMLFFHKDEFEKKYRSKWLPKYEFPVVLMASTDGLEIFLLKQELESLQTVSDLILAIEDRLAAY